MPPSLPTVLQYASAASAIVSAGLWFWSAVLRMPPFTVKLWENGRPARSTPRDDALNKQSKINAAAALAAGFAALLQGLSTALAPVSGG